MYDLIAIGGGHRGIVAVNNLFGKKGRMRYVAVPAVICTHPEVAFPHAAVSEALREAILGAR